MVTVLLDLRCPLSATRIIGGAPCNHLPEYAMYTRATPVRSSTFTLAARTRRQQDHFFADDPSSSIAEHEAPRQRSSCVTAADSGQQERHVQPRVTRHACLCPIGRPICFSRLQILRNLVNQYLGNDNHCTGKQYDLTYGLTGCSEVTLP